MTEYLLEYTQGPRKGQRIWASAPTAAKLEAVTRPVAEARPSGVPGVPGQVVAVGPASEQSGGGND